MKGAEFAIVGWVAVGIDGVRVPLGSLAAY
jgi:hypothetical protein